MGDLDAQEDQTFRIPVLTNGAQEFIVDSGSAKLLLSDQLCKEFLCGPKECNLDTGARYASKFGSGQAFEYFVPKKTIGVRDLLAKMGQKGDGFPNTHTRVACAVTGGPNLPTDDRRQMCFSPGLCFGGIVGLQPSAAPSLMGALGDTGFEYCRIGDNTFHLLPGDIDSGPCDGLRSGSSRAPLEGVLAKHGTRRVLFDTGTTTSHSPFEGMCVVGFDDFKYLRPDYKNQQVHYTLSPKYESLDDLIQENCNY